MGILPVLCLACFTGLPAAALGVRDTPVDLPPIAARLVPPPAVPILTIHGRLRLVGGEPFPDLVLTDPEGNEWYLDRQYRKALEVYQHREITLRGEAETREMILANGRVLGTRRFLRNAELEAVK
jgi:hypothetical protein